MKDQKVQKRELSVAEWRKLTMDGISIPVRILLDGSSMHPLIRRKRDHVTIQPLKRSPLRGDVVLFADDAGRYVVHRVCRLDTEFVVTQGDGCRRQDAPLRYDQIWGIVTKLERGKFVISMDSAGARNFGKFWMAILPVRLLHYHVRDFAGNIYRKWRER